MLIFPTLSQQLGEKIVVVDFWILIHVKGKNFARIITLDVILMELLLEDVETIYSQVLAKSSNTSQTLFVSTKTMNLKT